MDPATQVTLPAIGDLVIRETEDERFVGTVESVDESNNWPWVVVMGVRRHAAFPDNPQPFNTYTPASRWRPVRDGDGAE